MNRKYRENFDFCDCFVCYRLFQTATSSHIERFQLKLSPKAKEAFGQISRTAQERLVGDQTKVNFIEIISFQF
jgi:hypothetical protein